jgi:hypothetical protein
MEINKDENGRVYITPHPSASVSVERMIELRQKNLDTLWKHETEIAKLQYTQIIDLVKFIVTINTASTAVTLTAIAKEIGSTTWLLAAAVCFILSTILGITFVLRGINTLSSKFGVYKEKFFEGDALVDWMELSPPSFFEYSPFANSNERLFYILHIVIFAAGLVIALVSFVTI